MRPRLPLLISLVATLALVGAACGDDAGPDLTGQTSGTPTCVAEGDEPLTFGEGEIPRSVPGDFPVPAGAAVGSTMVDRVNHRTEFALTVRQEATAVAQFYTVNLPSAGFVVGRNEGDLVSWRIEFSRGEVLGELVIQPGGSGLAAMVVRFNTC